MEFEPCPTRHGQSDGASPLTTMNQTEKTENTGSDACGTNPPSEDSLLDLKRVIPELLTFKGTLNLKQKFNFQNSKNFCLGLTLSLQKGQFTKIIYIAARKTTTKHMVNLHVRIKKDQMKDVKHLTTEQELSCLDFLDLIVIIGRIYQATYTKKCL